MRWILVQAAHRGIQSPGALRSFYLRLKEKKGAKVAIVAVARKLLTLIWVVLTRKEPYKELRPDLFKRKVKRMERLAHPYSVTVDLTEHIGKFLIAESDESIEPSIGAAAHQRRYSEDGWPDRILVPSSSLSGLSPKGSLLDRGCGRDNWPARPAGSPGLLFCSIATHSFS